MHYLFRLGDQPPPSRSAQASSVVSLLELVLHWMNHGY
jgi:hypothetical protein